MRRPRAKSIQHRLEISFLQKNMILFGLAFLREHGERCHFRLCLAATDLVCLSIVLIVLFGFLFVRAIPPRTATPPENPSRNKRRKKAGIDLWTSRPFQLRSRQKPMVGCWTRRLDADPMLVYCWATVYDSVTTINHHWALVEIAGLCPLCLARV